MRPFALEQIWIIQSNSRKHRASAASVINGTHGAEHASLRNAHSRVCGLLSAKGLLPTKRSKWPKRLHRCFTDLRHGLNVACLILQNAKQSTAAYASTAGKRWATSLTMSLN